MRIVVKIGGSVSMKEHGPDHDYISSFLDTVDDLNEDHMISICIGGGDFVGSYSKSIEEFGLDDEERELCFIELMRANVILISLLTGKQPIFDFSKYDGGEAVVSGIEPGRSTDANAAEMAKRMGADLFVKLTDVDGIYDKDPSEYDDAKLIEGFDFGDIDFVGGKETPLDYGPLDPTALKIIKENRINTVLTNGKDLENLKKAVAGEDVGTVIG